MNYFKKISLFTLKGFHFQRKPFSEDKILSCIKGEICDIAVDLRSKSKTYKIGGSNFGYVEQFNYPLSPCYKNTVKAGWHSGGGSCGRRPVEPLTNEVDSEMYGGGFFDFFLGDEDFLGDPPNNGVDFGADLTVRPISASFTSSFLHLHFDLTQSHLSQ